MREKALVLNRNDGADGGFGNFVIVDPLDTGSVAGMIKNAQRVVVKPNGRLFHELGRRQHSADKREQANRKKQGQRRDLTEFQEFFQRNHLTLIVVKF